VCVPVNRLKEGYPTPKTLTISFSDIDYCQFVDATPPNDNQPYKIIGGRAKKPGGLGRSLWVLIQKKSESIPRRYVVHGRSEFINAADVYGKRCDDPNR
jgi:hypothetical protein